MLDFYSFTIVFHFAKIEIKYDIKKKYFNCHQNAKGISNICLTVSYLVQGWMAEVESRAP